MSDSEQLLLVDEVRQKTAEAVEKDAKLFAKVAAGGAARAFALALDAE